MKTIKETRRKIIRYLLFTKKNNTYTKPIVSKKVDKEIIKYYETHKNFTSWDDFEVKWDIGFGDDVVASNNRLEKWFLVNKGKEEIVFRPKNYWAKESKRTGLSSHTLFILESQRRGITIEEFYKLFFNN